MRRKEREITDLEEIKQVVSEAQTCRIAMNDGEYPYIVPVNFGHEFEGDVLRIYLHGAPAGKKWQLIQQDPHVSFELDVRHQLITSEDPCHYSFGYASIIGFGIAAIVTDLEEKNRALQLLMKQMTGKFTADFESKKLKGLGIIRIDIKSYTGKAHLLK